MNNWHEISREDDLPNVCEIVLVELQNGEKQVAQLDYNKWIGRLGWAIPNGTYPRGGCALRSRRFHLCVSATEN